MRRLRPMRLRWMCLAPLRRLRRLRRLLLVNWTLPRLLRRNHVPTTLKDITCHGRVLLDPARSAFSCGLRFLRPAFLAALAAEAVNSVDKRRRAS
jgi:hypothetical protein